MCQLYRILCIWYVITYTLTAEIIELAIRTRIKSFGDKDITTYS
jgi:hypothetical protein